MFAAFHPVGPRRIRESIGLVFEDFAAGQVFHHRPGITVTQPDNAGEALATLNQAMVHYDHHYALQTEWRRPLVVSTLTLQRAVGMGWKTFGRRRRILAFRSIVLVAPVFDGDTLYARSRILETKPGEDPDCGIVVAEAGLVRSDGTEVLRALYEMAIYRAGRGPLETLGYAAPTAPGDAGAWPAYARDEAGGFVETIGIELDAMEEGTVIEHRPGFTLSWGEADLRARIAGDHAPAALDPAIAAAAGGGQPAISEAWLVGAFAATTTRAFGRVVANLAWENIAFPAPARDGDTVFAESAILGKRLSRSRPDQGILTVHSRGLTRDGREVCRFDRTLLVYRSAAGPHRAAGYV